MIGQNLGHYRILRELGSGGMGTVYLAEDTKLGRNVALKILAEETARDPERRARFLREARAVAALNHPNIVVIHSVEEDRGIPFITMELVTGRRLSEMIPAGGMRLRDVFAVAVPLADAINAAHRQGVTHRDLKPDNVMVTDDGRVKVLDFGLAKLFEAAPADHGMTMTVADVATREGKILGTAAYMSPEQAEGKPVDARTDIFALGVILFEMLTGRRPFTGDSQVSTLSSVLRDTPPAVHEVKPELPRHLGRIVNRCLAKEPDRRYQTALDVRNELEGLKDEVQSDPGSGSALAMSSPGVASSPGIASSPGASWSGASSAAGPPTPVTPPPSTWPTPPPSSAGPSTSSGVVPPPGRGRSPVMFAVSAVAVVAVAAALFFGLRGRSHEAGDTGRAVAARETKDEAGARSIVVLPFENLGPPEDAYFAAGITDEIMSRLANVDGLTVLSRTTAVQYDKTGRTMRQIGEDLGVSYVLEGTVRWEKMAGGSSRVRVVPQLIRAADDTPVWSDRYEESMEEIFAIQSSISSRVVDALGVTLLEPARMALATRLTDNVEAYHAYLKAMEYVEGVGTDESNLRLGIDLLSRAIELDPGFLVAHAVLAKQQAGMIHFNYDSSPARLALADAEVKRVEELDGNSPWNAYARGWVAYWGRKDLDEAVAQMEQVRDEMPGNADVLMAIGYIRRRQGRYEDGLESLQRAAEKDPRNGLLLWSIAETYCLLDRFDRASSELDRVISLFPDAGNAYRLKAESALAQGKFDEAKSWVDRAPTMGDPLSRIRFEFATAFFRGDREAALGAAAKFGDLQVDQFDALSGPLQSGLVEAFLGTPEKAREQFTRSIPILEKASAETPDDSRILMALALAHAGLGDRGAALREIEAAYAGYPANRDKWIRSVNAVTEAYAWMLLGDREAATERWKTLMESPGAFIPSRVLLRISPVFDSLREVPEFRKLYETAS